MNINSLIREYFVNYLSDFYPIFDKRQGVNNENLCYLITSQNVNIIKDTKCGVVNEASIEIEIIQRLERSSNSVSTKILEDLELNVINAFNSINLTNFVISNKDYNSNSLNAEMNTGNTNKITDNINKIIVNINLNLWNNE